MEISSSTIVEASPKQVRQWFRNIGQEPQRYRFATHGGVVGVSGRLDQVGTVFETRERFLGLPVRLRFKLNQVEPESFTFRLIKPLAILEIRGQFILKQLQPPETRLTLRIFPGKSKAVPVAILQGLFFFSPLRWLIKHQIRAETVFVKQAVESA